MLDGLLGHVQYVASNFDDPNGYARLAKALDKLDEEAGQPLNRAYYLSTAPEFFPVIIEQLKAAGLHRHKQADVRCVIEKPFGTDLQTARRLQKVVESVFRERQVFRIDHYLGKETVQNVMAFRFANMMFEPVWNRNYIDHIQITGRRGHRHRHARRLLRPGGRAARPRAEPHAAARRARPAWSRRRRSRPTRCATRRSRCSPRSGRPTPEETRPRAVHGGHGRAARRRRATSQEEGVPAGSHTETYAALKLEVHNWRWAGVPIFLRTGKRLARKVTEIAVQFKPVPHLAFQSEGSVGVQPNQLILTVQPNEGVSMSLGAKIPGSKMRIRPVNMEFLYGSAFMSQSPEAYERLILDAMRGDATLFTRNDEVDAQWTIIDPILQRWHATDGSGLPTYEAGTAGPAEADALLGDRSWRAL